MGYDVSRLTSSNRFNWNPAQNAIFRDYCFQFPTSAARRINIRALIHELGFSSYLHLVTDAGVVVGDLIQTKVLSKALRTSGSSKELGKDREKKNTDAEDFDTQEIEAAQPQHQVSQPSSPSPSSPEMQTLTQTQIDLQALLAKIALLESQVANSKPARKIKAKKLLRASTAPPTTAAAAPAATTTLTTITTLPTNMDTTATLTNPAQQLTLSLPPYSQPTTKDHTYATHHAALMSDGGIGIGPDHNDNIAKRHLHFILPVDQMATRAYPRYASAPPPFAPSASNGLEADKLATATLAAQASTSASIPTPTPVTIKRTTRSATKAKTALQPEIAFASTSASAITPGLASAPKLPANSKPRRASSNRTYNGIGIDLATAAALSQMRAEIEKLVVTTKEQMAVGVKAKEDKKKGKEVEKTSDNASDESEEEGVEEVEETTDDGDQEWEEVDMYAPLT
ncbi:hypothetical protein LZ554_009545 [Drepanopeziza brunnea f. sp. 'monogermtubi']|nr:hypothetical protein LZ554_009545 [Drepanopeziza brunnea f. sp. 'monogermtubi']